MDQHDRVLARQDLELAIEQRRALLVERGERLVEHEQRRIVEQRAAQREPLRHPAGVGRDPIAAHVPETEPLEQRPASLAALGHPIETSEELQVLERSQLAVRHRLVAPDSRDRRARLRPRSFPRVGAARPATSRSRVVLPEPFGPVTSRKPWRARLNVTPRSARLRPYRFSRPSAVIIGVAPPIRRSQGWWRSAAIHPPTPIFVPEHSCRPPLPTSLPRLAETAAPRPRSNLPQGHPRCPERKVPADP